MVHFRQLGSYVKEKLSTYLCQLADSLLSLTIFYRYIKQGFQIPGIPLFIILCLLSSREAQSQCISGR